MVISSHLPHPEAYHSVLLQSIPIDLILNCFRSFLPHVSENEDAYRTVELGFLYLLQLFVTNTASVIQSFPTVANTLLHFLFELLFSPDVAQTTPDAQFQPREMTLNDYVMTLFGLICYNRTFFSSLANSPGKRPRAARRRHRGVSSHP